MFMSSPNLEHMERDDKSEREWDDIVQRLGDDLFTDVPDIIATPTPMAAAASDAPTSGDPAAQTDVHVFDDDAHFVPPAPPAPRLTRRTRAAWACAACGIGLLITASVAGFADTWSTVLGLALAGTAVVLLFQLIPTHRDDPDDDGAVV